MPTRIRPRTACAPADDLSNPIPEEFCDHLGFVLARARLELIRGLDAVIQPSGLQARHFALVRLLLQRPGLSQAQISALLGTPVHLDLQVKVLEDWQSDPRYLNRLGF